MEVRDHQMKEILVLGKKRIKNKVLIRMKKILVKMVIIQIMAVKKIILIPINQLKYLEQLI